MNQTVLALAIFGASYAVALLRTVDLSGVYVRADSPEGREIARDKRERADRARKLREHSMSAVCFCNHQRSSHVAARGRCRAALDPEWIGSWRSFVRVRPRLCRCGSFRGSVKNTRLTRGLKPVPDLFLWR